MSKRTHPLDRDGDGKPGGSLPGNATAPFAGATDPAADQATDPAPGDTPADDATTVSGPETETPAEDATTATDQAAEQTADQAADQTPGDTSADDATTVSGPETETPAEDATTATDQATDPAPGDKPADDADTAPADKAPTIAKAVKADQAMREADARAKAKAGAKVQIADDLLVRFGGAERHYLTEDGYSPSYRAPFISEDDAKALIDAGLAESVPSMGWRGGIRPTPAGRLAVHRAARRAQQHRDALRRAD